MKKIQFGLEKATGIPVALCWVLYTGVLQTIFSVGLPFPGGARQAGPCEASPAAVISFPFELIYCVLRRSKCVCCLHCDLVNVEGCAAAAGAGADANADEAHSHFTPHSDPNRGFHL